MVTKVYLPWLWTWWKLRIPTLGPRELTNHSQCKYFLQQVRHAHGRGTHHRVTVSVFCLKQTTDSASPKYKAKIVAKGFWQEYGVDFDEVFSPVLKMTTLCFLLGVVAVENFELLQLDVKTTFLHSELGEEIYMEQHQGLASLGQEHLFCRLWKSLHGLK